MRTYFVIAVMAAAVLLGCTAGVKPVATAADDYAAAEMKATIYKSRSCGCCVGYVAELEKAGFDVETVNVPVMSSVKEQYNIPSAVQSCHTVVIGDYIVEGHVPLEAVQKLLEEQPDIDGIALPDMPPGSPGMPGAKRERFRIFALSDGEVSEFMSV